MRQFNLCWKLALAYKGLASPSLLPSYQAERLTVVTHMLIATSNLYTHMVPKKSEDVAAATANMDKTGFLQWRNQSLHMFEVNYRWSPVVYDARGTLGLDEDDMKARAYEVGRVRTNDLRRRVLRRRDHDSGRHDRRVRVPTSSLYWHDA